ncbi:winged helix DNA-binding domain-containing protein [Nakamurella sp. YIM 132087]|uniref:Winged helix DNA-binding domain-containing protein n=1 Tax=Nakamurella alba TaxID=2665158 RepID=A0A7K1FQD8_9ACTN|nr:crosslink repair DNA glycosylase YcaQ family protein [Nakamurella alba]MTD16358.1 winged helix DNA-binding domain-containing protein [Nakamurella alba]
MGAKAQQVTAAQVRAYRILASGLDRSAASVAGLGVLDLGVQDTGGWSVLALGNRLPADHGPVDVGTPGSSSDLALAWSLRGTPHVHRRSDLPVMAAAIWPRNSDDAKARLMGRGDALVGAGIDPLQALADAAGAFRSAVTTTMTKGEASTAVREAGPPEISAFCRACEVVHPMEQLFRLAALPGGVGAVPDTRPIELARLRPAVRLPKQHDGSDGLVDRYLDRYGCGSAAEIGAFLGTSAAAIAPDLPDTVRVTVDGHPGLSTDDHLSRIQEVDVDAARAVVRLLPPGDPLLSARDRSVLTDDTEQRKALWPHIGTPGAVLAGGRIVGAWRPKRSGKKLTVTVALWGRLTKVQRAELADEAVLAASLRGAVTGELAGA